MMLYTKYQGSRPCGFRQEDFSRFPYISLCKICDPGGGPKLKALWFQARGFSCFPYIGKACDPGEGPFLTPGALIEQTW